MMDMIILRMRAGNMLRAAPGAGNTGRFSFTVSIQPTVFFYVCFFLGVMVDKFIIVLAFRYQYANFRENRVLSKCYL